MQEWNWEKNNALGILPDKITCGSDKKVWWKCKNCGYEWQSDIAHRTNRKTGCPRCARQKTIASHYKKVLNIDTGKNYNSVKDASEISGVSRDAFSNCCCGKSKTAGGYHWKYLEEEDNYFVR